MSGFITTETINENRELIAELFGTEVLKAALTTTAKTWIEFMTSQGIL